MLRRYYERCKWPLVALKEEGSRHKVQNVIRSDHGPMVFRAFPRIRGLWPRTFFSAPMPISIYEMVHSVLSTRYLLYYLQYIVVPA